MSEYDYRIIIDGTSPPRYYATEAEIDKKKKEGGQMPASQKAVFEAFEVSAGPAWWLRRWTRFPLYFQVTKPRFLIRVKKREKSNLGALQFYIEFSDHTQVQYTVDVSKLAIGQTLHYETNNTLLAPSGDTRICHDRGRAVTGQFFDTVYAFVVSPEATLVFLILNVVLGGLIALLLKL